MQLRHILIIYNMDMQESENPCTSGSFVMSAVFKFEIAIIFLFLLNVSEAEAFATAMVCGAANQIAEVYYSRSTFLKAKIAVLGVSLVGLILIYFVALAAHVNFCFSSQAQPKFDTIKFLLVARLLVSVGAILGTFRLAAVTADYLLFRRRSSGKHRIV
jgi:hypothetical protein